ncbi:MAG: GAF domain-containing protein [Candidatus Zixiibacteriota bacterium]
MSDLRFIALSKALLHVSNILEYRYPKEFNSILPAKMEAYLNKIYIETLKATCSFLTHRQNNCDSAALIKTYVPNNKCVVRASYGIIGKTSSDLDTNLLPSVGIINNTLEARKIIVKNDPEDSDVILRLGDIEIDYIEGKKPKSVMCIPAMFDRLKLGVILLQSGERNYFSEADLYEYWHIGTLLANVFKHDPYWKIVCSI